MQIPAKLPAQLPSAGSSAPPHGHAGRFLLCTERLREVPRPPPAAAPCVRCTRAETPGPGRKPLESES